MATTITKTFPLKTPSSLKNSIWLPSLVGASGWTKVQSRAQFNRFNKEFAKIKEMDTESTNILRFSLAATVWISLLGLPNALAVPTATPVCGDETSHAEEKRRVERLNERYDDFYKRRSEMEANEELRERNADEIKKLRAQYAEGHEKARQEFVKNRKPKEKEDPRLEQEWLEQEQARKEMNKMARNCFVRSKEDLKAIEKKGRRIPEMKEYDLDE